jgi:RNA polymerase II-associated protein 1
MAHKSAIVGSVVERKPTSSFSTPKAAVSGNTGFPAVQHRSKSAFARNRDDLRRSVSRPKDVPTALPTNVHPVSTEPADWRQQISKENEERVADMTDEQRGEEIQQILERFGSSVGDVLKRARLARETKSVTGKTAETIDTGGKQHSQGHSTLDLFNFLLFNLWNS